MPASRATAEAFAPRAILSASGILRIRTQRGRHRPVLVRSRSPFSTSKPSKNRSRSKRTALPERV